MVMQDTTVASPPCFAQLIAEACRRPAARRAGWPDGPAPDHSGPWLALRHPNAHLPEQGWKLHVSASIFCAEETLRRALPVLLAEPTAFKVAASHEALGLLNHGMQALSQVGKFITVYPAGDAQAVRLAHALDDATRGLAGPDVPSDRPLRPGSRVFYRYGGFGGLTVQNKLGEILPALRTPAGGLTPDLRTAVYQPPAWAVDPFHPAQPALAPPPSGMVVAGRYLVLTVLHRSARGTVYFAVDLDRPRRCVLKQARTSAQVGIAGREPADQLRREAESLRRLAPDPRFPEVLDLVEQDGDLYLVLEYIAGETLEQHVIGHALLGRTIPLPRVIAWGRALAAMLGTIHAAGLIYRDLKSPNVLVTPEGRLCLVDFDLASPPGEGAIPGIGTRGYASPQQDAGAPASVADDIYGLGALLFYMLTGAEPSQAPKQFNLLDRPLCALNPAATNDALARVVARCLAPDPADRSPTTAAVDAALAAALTWLAPAAPPYGGKSLLLSEGEEQARAGCRALARRLGDSICASAEHIPGEPGLSWVSQHPQTAGVRTRDVNTGAAGTLLALAEIVAEFDDPAHRAVLAEGACWLTAAPRPGGEPLPGLYVGEAGIGAALLRAGQVLGSPALIDEAARRGRWIATMPYESPDLFNGTAGRLRFHLFLWQATAAREHRAAAVAAGEALLAAAEETRNGGRRWPIPDGYGGLSGNAYLGYAHGAAGIADALLDLHEATGDRRFLDVAHGAARWLAGLALPALDDGSGLNWPSIEGKPSAAAYWCHGAAGIGLFFLHAAALDLLPGASDLATGALRTAARGARWAGTPLCHGLAGGIEVLLDAYQATGDPAHLVEARSLSRLLEAFALERDGLLLWTAERPLVVTPDYLVGYAGIATTLLRLADPEHRPHALSLRGIRPHTDSPGKEVAWTHR